MTPEAQRIAIAEACGWKDIKHCSCKTEPCGIQPEVHSNTKDEHVHLPRYLSDLNAMHEAEKVLPADQKTDYIRLLNKGDFGYRRLAFATAAERAEAFLRALNFWDDNK